MANPNDIQAAEAEFKKKYGGLGGGRPGMGSMGAPGGRPMNSVLAKRLQGGGQKWFDSGDYNMNKQGGPGGMLQRPGGMMGPGGMGVGGGAPNSALSPPIYKQTSQEAVGAGDAGAQQQPNLAFKKPPVPSLSLSANQHMPNQASSQQITSPTKSKLAS
jgi:hypothetical protein